MDIAMDTETQGEAIPGGQGAPTQFNMDCAQTLLPPKLCYLVDEGEQELQPKGYHVAVGRTRQSALQVKHSSVSERHALISWTGQHWQLVDVGSSFGTVHNGKLLRPQEDLVALADGDTVQFGDITGTIQLTPCSASEVTVGQLLEAQLEAMLQTLRAHQQQEADGLKKEWQDARAELVAAVTATATATVP